MVFIHIMKGDFDSELHWPIRYKCSIVLTNQINSKDNLVDHTEISKEWLETYPGYLNRSTGIRNDDFHVLLVHSFQTLKYCKKDTANM